MHPRIAEAHGGQLRGKFLVPLPADIGDAGLRFSQIGSEYLTIHQHLGMAHPDALARRGVFDLHTDHGRAVLPEIIDGAAAPGWVLCNRVQMLLTVGQHTVGAAEFRVAAPGGLIRRFPRSVSRGDPGIVMHALIDAGNTVCSLGTDRPVSVCCNDIGTAVGVFQHQVTAEQLPGSIVPGCADKSKESNGPSAGHHSVQLIFRIQLLRHIVGLILQVFCVAGVTGRQHFRRDLFPVHGHIIAAHRSGVEYCPPQFLFQCESFTNTKRNGGLLPVIGNGFVGDPCTLE